VSDELFRARVEPRRAHAPAAGAGSPGGTGRDGGDDHADQVLEDLMASFERRRKASAQEFDDAESSGSVPPDGAPAGDVTTADPRHDQDPATLPSRRSVVPRRRARDPWLVGGAALVITAGVAAAVMSGPLFGDDPASERSTVATTTLKTQAGPSGSPTSPLVHSLLSTATGPTDGADDPSAAADAQAAAWVAAYVGGGKMVACDVAVCGMLRNRGFPTTAFVVAQTGLQVEGADVVVVTDLLRRQLGSFLDGLTAAEPLAVFTAESSTVEIYPVALSGAAGYTTQLATDRAARRTAGLQLLRNKRITVTGAARTELATGEVDTRVCALLAALSGSHDVVVEAFTGAGPGAGPDVPAPGVVISGFDGADAVGPSPQAKQLKNIVDAQQPPYVPLSVGAVAAGTGNGLAVLFDQPGRLGLLTGAGS
jgi:hypothetical protein